MIDPELLALVERLRAGTLSPVDFASALADGSGTLAVGDFARADMHRSARTGIPEFIYAPGKTPEQIIAIATRMLEAGATLVLATKVPEETAAVVLDGEAPAEYHPDCGMLVFGSEWISPRVGNVTIVTAGTADLALARETELVCHALGSEAMRITDIGVAGVHRLFETLPRLREAHVIVCVAGMEGALPSVIAGLVPCPVIALPASIGYGVNAGGINAMLTSIGSCVPGLVTVNIDNGVGAAVAAHRINLLAAGAAHA